MLPSSPSPSRPSYLAGTRVVTGYKLVVFLCAMLLAYTAVVGFGILSGSIATDSSYFLIALGCLLPAIVGFYGFVIGGDEKDWSLLYSGLAWICVFLALLVQDSVLRSARASAAPGELVVPPDTPAGTIVFGFLAVVFGIASLVLGYQSWSAGVPRRDY